MTNGIYLSFAVTEVGEAGGLPGLKEALSGPVLYMSFGVAGLLGLFTAELNQRLGIAALVAGIFLASAVSLALIGIAPATWAGLIVSAGLQGMCVMMLSAIYSFWSNNLFPALATLGFTAVLTVFAFGNIVGPALAGALAPMTGISGVFLMSAAVSLATALAFLIRHLRSGSNAV
ncbi:hypothetical protein [Larsenimonas salina]|uniref:hypothetical protein n=1 Tax=Larsenimonas salina TaxID=1295565 RepID=UPI0020749E0E|nr:hypothetical protein [Larsenimonas salina]MCM5703997.1 hypothetical protein [Larsenimonas salina]